MTRVIQLTASTLVLAACAGTASTTTESGAEVPLATDATQQTQPVTEAAEPFELPPNLRVVTGEWETDFTLSSIDLNELQVGIRTLDPRDAIPPIDDPSFETVTGADEWLEDDEPGLLVDIGDTTRFYPIRILHRHEIVNDRFGDVFVAVTYCPLCNTGIAFDRRVDGEVLRMGVSGLLRNSDLVMWDDVTQSLWQQITGEAIVGELTGTRLEPLSSAIVRWADFRDNYPDSEVLGRDQGFGIRYGQNPYVGYSSRSAPIGGFFTAELDGRFPALERVVAVTVDDSTTGYPFSIMSDARVVNDEVGGVPVAIFWGAPSTTDALDSFQVADGQAIGTGVAFDPVVEGRPLTFESPEVDVFVDFETGSTWTLQGLAVDGPLAGAELALLPHRNEFWFAFAAFFPDATVHEG
ncbi:MAG: DUF3179 domain-containing protein [Acidimicrobiia bacterium]|nr:DUF3179 domain-containing protein [Acidimicrobiia bacterium]